MGISSPQKHIISPNDTLLLGFANTEGTAYNTTYVQYKEIRVGIKGMYRVKFSLKSQNGSWLAYGKIYKNGLALGTERSTVSTSYVTFTEDLDFDCLDLLQLWTKVQNVSWASYWKDLKIYGDLGDPVVLLDT